MKFKKPGMAILSEMVNLRLLEDSISESTHKKHIIEKYVNIAKAGSMLHSRNKLDSLRFNYSFGDKYIDNNEALKAFMTRNIDKRRFKRTPLDFELRSLTTMVKEK
jgi:hypothetical protein